MRSKYAIRNGILSIVIFVISGILQFVTRKVMYPVLGSEIVGLTATFTDILSFLNLSDMGISGSVGACLYEPINNKDYPKIKGILYFLKKAYKVCGIAFSSMAILISAIMLFAFQNEAITNIDASFYFFLTAANTGLSFFFSYRLILLSTDQRLFSLKLINAAVKIFATVFKVLVLITTKSFALFLGVDILFTCFYYLIMNGLLRKKYAYVENAGPLLEQEDKSRIVRNIKGLAFHKIGGFALYGTNNFYTAIFSGLVSAAILSNYQMIITFINGLVINFSYGITASIGNLISTDSTKRRYQTFRTIFMVSGLFVIAASITFTNSAQDFIHAFFGSQYLADKLVVYLLAINFFLSGIRPVTEQFKNAAGIFYEDRYVPLMEATLNALCCIVLGLNFGLVGIIAGNIVSTIAIVFWQKPYMTFKYVFDTKLRYYFFDLFQYIAVGIVCYLVSSALCGMIPSQNLWLRFFEQVGISLSVCILAPLILFYRTTRFQNFLAYLKKH